MAMEFKCTVSALLARDSRYLMVLGAKDNKWALPGGKKEKGESLTETLQREMREEIGTPVQVKGIIGVYQFISDNKNDILNIVYEAHPRHNPRITRPQEIKDLAWLSNEDIEELIHQGRVKAPRAQYLPIQDHLKRIRYASTLITALLEP